ncbi:Protein unc-45 A [Borealophlyctis nickersoniae]|nr:Protein unc-45 A [Borealophlyctis nickersoniae]
MATGTGLENAAVDSEQFLRRAVAYEALGQYDRAFADVRTALSLDKHHPDAIKSMQRLLQVTNDKSSSQAPSLKTLLVWASGGIADAEVRKSGMKEEIGTSGDYEETALGRRVEAAQRLAVMSSERDVADSIVRQGGIELLLPAFLKERREHSTGEGASSLQDALLRILAHIAAIPDHGPLMLGYVSDDNVELFLEQAAISSVQIASDMLASLVLHSLSHMSLPNLKSGAITIIRNFARRLRAARSEEVRVAAFNGLIKAAGSNDAALALVSAPEFIDILTLADDKSEKLRGLVPVALARLFEQIDSKNEPIVKDACYKIVGEWLESDVPAQKAKGLLAFAAVFQASSSIGSDLLQREGIMASLVDIAEFEPPSVQLATIEALSSACTDNDCRKLVASRASDFLLSMSTSADAELQIAASVALVKIMSTDKGLEKRVLEDPTGLARLFITAINANPSQSPVSRNAVEALAYLTVNPAIKELMAHDSKLLQTLFALAIKEERSLRYGIANILSNITAYRKRLTPEEEQVRKLRELAKDADVVKESPLDDDGPVAKRCVAVANAGGIAALATIAKTPSEGVRQAVAETLLNLATDRQLRGALVAQGGAKALVSLANGGTAEGVAVASHALAKVAISVDPNLAFKGERATELVRPLISLCNGESELRQFEALMALTNLASMNDEVRTRIVQAKGVKAFEYLQFSDNELVRRAATESICNMMFDPQVFHSYVEGGAGRLRMLVALSDVDDLPTRKAASGALAILSGSEKACRLIMEESRGLEVVMGLAGENEPELQHRGVECIKNIAKAKADFARRLEAAGVVSILKALVRGKHDVIAEGAMETLSSMRAQGVLLA